MKRVGFNAKGFTLVELVVAILVFALGILGIAKMQGLSTGGTSYGMHMSQAVNIAQDKLEEIKELPLTSNTFNVGTPSIPEFTKTVDGIDYTVRYNVKSVSPVGVREVEIRVEWPEVTRNPAVSITFIKR